MHPHPALSDPPPLLALLAHDVRWRLVQALALSDLRVQELVALVQRPLNLVSYHLKQLRNAQVVSERRSSADARDLYYHLDLAHLHMLYQASGQQIHPAFAPTAAAALDAPPAVTPAPQAPLRVLFLCTHNSARSQLAEALARTLGRGKVVAASAGSAPAAAIHPDALQVLAQRQIDTSQQYPKQLAALGDQQFDYIITVCDRAREQCPTFPGDPAQIHWSFADPAEIADPVARYRQFETVARELSTRITYLLQFAERAA